MTGSNSIPDSDFNQEQIRPHSVESEESVLGSCLIDHEGVGRIADSLTPEDFYSQRNRLVYIAIRRLHERGGPIDQVSVAHELGDDLEAVGGAAYLAGLVATTPTSVHVRHYADTVTRTASQRRLIKAIENVHSLPFINGSQPHELAELISDQILAAAPRPLGFATEWTFREAVDDFLEGAGKPKGERFPTGFQHIDPSLGGGLDRGSLCILAADTGHGKTTLAMQWAVDWATEGRNVEVLSYEMTAVSLVQRAIAARAGVPSLSLEDAVRNQSADQAAIYDVAGQLSDLPINVTTRVRDMNSLEGYVRRRHRSKPVDVVIMDHLQMLPMSDTQHRVAQMDDAAIRLKRLALDLNCVVIGISQPNRSGLNGNKRLTVSALRDSHGIGANADVVMALHQPELRDKAETRQKVVLHFAKNRFGPDGSEQALHFDSSFSRFREWSGGNSK